MKTRSNMDRTALLAEFFPEAPQAFFDRLLEPRRQRLFHSEELLYSKGHPVEGLHLMFDGIARLEIDQSAGIDWALPGDWLGMVDLIQNRPHSHNARVHSADLNSCYLDRESFYDLFAGFPQIGLPILQRLTSNVGRVERWMSGWKGSGVDTRLESMFEVLNQRFGSDAEGFLKLQVNPGQMAAWIGANRTTVYRQLKKLQLLGRIEIDQSRVRLLQWAEPKGE